MRDIKVKTEHPITIAGRYGCSFISSTGKIILVDDKWNILLKIAKEDVDTVRNIAGKQRGSLYVAIADGIGYILEDGGGL